MATKREMCAAEEAGWTEIIDLVESLSAEQLLEPGYFGEGWSVKDMLGHIGSWLAETVQVLEQVRMGTFRASPVEVDDMNRRFFEANRDLPLPVVKAEAWSARTRMLTEMNLLVEVTLPAEEWFVESGAAHYAEHLPRLGEWAEELRSR